MRRLFTRRWLVVRRGGPNRTIVVGIYRWHWMARGRAQRLNARSESAWHYVLDKREVL